MKRSALLICDLQHKTVKNLYDPQKVIHNVNKFLYMKDSISDIKNVVVSEFIPEKLGSTVKSLNHKAFDLVYSKDSYTMVNDELTHFLEENKIENIILTGMEIQWCLNNSTRDLSKKYNVYIPVDCVGNKEQINTYNLEHLKNQGGKLCTSDALIANFLEQGDSDASIRYLTWLKKNDTFLFEEYQNNSLKDGQQFGSLALYHKKNTKP